MNLEGNNTLYDSIIKNKKVYKVMLTVLNHIIFV